MWNHLVLFGIFPTNSLCGYLHLLFWIPSGKFSKNYFRSFFQEFLLGFSTGTHEGFPERISDGFSIGILEDSQKEFLEESQKELLEDFHKSLLESFQKEIRKDSQKELVVFEGTVSMTYGNLFDLNYYLEMHSQNELMQDSPEENL